MQESVEIGGSKENIPCDECGLITRCHHTEDTLGNRNWYCWKCITFIYGDVK